MEIYIVRHGRTEYNEMQKLQGRTDIPLNEGGIRQARAAAAAIGGAPYARVYTSPLKRAVATAGILSGLSRPELTVDPRLEEMCFGVMEGRKLSELPPSVLALFNRPEDFVPAEGGESIEQLKARCLGFLDDMKKDLAALPQDSRILVVSHGATIHGLLSCITGSPMSEFWRYKVLNCTAIRVGFADGKLTLEQEPEAEKAGDPRF